MLTFYFCMQTMS